MRNLTAIKDVVEEVCGAAPTESSVWRMLRKDPVSRKIRDFLWKAIHGAHRIGRYWAHIPGYEERQMCVGCGAVEDMAHILTTCLEPGQCEVWTIARELLLCKLKAVPDVSLGMALGSHMMAVLNEEGEMIPGQTRALRIVLTEATHLIWALRCERVIGWVDEPGRKHTKPEIRRRFEAKLNQRLSLDQAGTNVRVHKKKALSVMKVKKTWEGLLKDECLLPTDWINITGVLVGIPSYQRRRDSG